MDDGPRSTSTEPISSGSMNDAETPARRSLTIRIPETRVMTRCLETPRTEKVWKAPPWPFSATPGVSATNSVSVAGGATDFSGSRTLIATLTGEKFSSPGLAVTAIAS